MLSRDSNNYAVFIAEQRYKRFYEQVPILNRTITVKGIIVDCNGHYARELGYSKEEIVGSSIFDHAPQNTHDELRKEFEMWQKSGACQDTESWLLRKDGTTFLISLPSIENQTNQSLDEKNPTKSVSIMSTLME